MTLGARRLAVVLLAAIAALTLVAVWRGCASSGTPGVLPAGDGQAARLIAYTPGDRADRERRAAAGLAQVLFAKSPGGAVATAQRVAKLRPLVERAAQGCVVSADTLEAVVFLESAGEHGARASDDLRGAVGLTQILAQTGAGLLGMRIDSAAATAITRRLRRTTDPRTRRILLARRARVDERFDPAKALAGTCRYLRFAKGRLGGREDLAIQSYHMGVGNLQRALAAYGKGSVPYAQLYFDSSPLRHPAAWNVIGPLGDDSSTYYWRILAAARIMRDFRSDRNGLAAEQRLRDAVPSAERVLHPPAQAPRFADAGALETSALVLLDGRVLGRNAGRLAAELARAPAGERALRPDAARTLKTLLSAVAATAPGTGPLTITAATRSVAGERKLGLAFGIEAAPSMHTTGFAFDISRAYRSRAQAQALQFWLDRLTALDLIAWARMPGAIHVAAAGGN